ncbi:hypothetical protein PA25_02410 [Pseudoalteromonas sp. A25]|uniref:RNA polymerase sigma factor n=1 Tax=Pseudoalteromonas sp. A25 TaxID=116092 RepID=UPI001260A7BB|nr:sigma-70 family RNA polymerase sigma factor [Pseudoalteromonas sp. A25]BBN80256.1 hypothetical protein PA25_02410 [Pseudoalteromonas sp. A25]
MNISSFEQQLENNVLKARQGDINAFNKLVAVTTSTVDSIALAITKDRDATQDVSQQVFLKAWQDLAKLKNNHSFLPWIRQITRHTAINFLRDNKSHIVFNEERLQACLETLSTQQHIQEINLLKSEQRDIVHALISNLPDESREIVILFYREAQDSKAVATLLGLSDSNVRKRLQRARELLKEQVLARYGQILLSSAPVSIISLTSLTTSTTASAASAASAAGSKLLSGSVGKVSLIFSGAFIGGLAALLANIMNTHCVASLCRDNKTKNSIKQSGKLNSLGIIICTLVMAIGYTYTEGWFMPAIAYLLLAIFLSLGQYNVHQALFSKNAKFGVKSHVIGLAGLVLGLLSGAAGLYYGLENSGRLVRLF